MLKLLANIYISIKQGFIGYPILNWALENIKIYKYYICTGCLKRTAC